MTETGYIVFAHGSSVESANDAVRAVSRNVAAQGGFAAVETAFLEGGKPDLRGAVDTLIAGGIQRVIVVPYFLTTGLHLKRDLPRLVEDIRGVYPEIDIRVTPPLDGHPAMVDVLIGRARDAQR